MFEPSTCLNLSEILDSSPSSSEGAMSRPVVFTYWARNSRLPAAEAFAGDTIGLEERVEYVISFRRPLSPTEAQRLTDIGGEAIQGDLAVLAFGNFVGRTELAGVQIEVVSTKIGYGGVSRVLQEISELASSLIFGWGSPTGFEGAGGSSRHAPVPYHQLQFLRHAMLGMRPGQRMQDWLGAIERNPTRRFEPERPVVSPGRVRRLDNRAVQSIFSRLERLVPVTPATQIAGNPIALRLTFGTPPKHHFPALVAAPRGRLSFDTLENRFVRHVVSECLALVYRFVDHPKLHEGLKADCRIMLGILEVAADAPFLAEAGRLTSFQAPSQALAKADGYRDVFAFWSDLSRHISLPRTATETTRLLEGRDMATLYEYWMFLKVIEAAVAVTGRALLGRPMVRWDELGESLSLGLKMGLGSDITIRFNPTFRRADATAYSTPLRPDVTIQVGQWLHAFDAKYRLDWFDSGESESDDGAATYKRADLYKMHTYRDAISEMRTAFVVYPGTEFVFFERSGNKRSMPESVGLVDGVGAIPLRPADADPSTNLRQLLRILFTRPESIPTS
jgi:predicted component of viral defense system (DUF524 family)